MICATPDPGDLDQLRPVYERLTTCGIGQTARALVRIAAR
jgi:hypothetical protein